MMYPRFVFKDGGLIDRAGGTYSHELVNDEAEHKSAIASGWHDNLQDAIDAHKVEQVMTDKDENKDAESIKYDPPTREEMEAKAMALGIKFDGRIGDKKLMALIEKAM